MNVLKRSLILILMALLLPWGAFGTTFPDAATPFVSAEVDTDRVMEISVKKRKCRTATLPGSSCGPDVLDEQAFAISPAAPIVRVMFRQDDLWHTQFGHSPPKGPPRFS